MERRPGRRGFTDDGALSMIHLHRPVVYPGDEKTRAMRQADMDVHSDRQCITWEVITKDGFHYVQEYQFGKPIANLLAAVNVPK